MTAIEPTGQVLGATVSGIDLSKPVSDRDFATISSGPRPAWRLAGPGAAAGGGRAQGLLAALRPDPGHAHREAPRARDAKGDHIGTLHNAIADYRPDERRLMKRCQVMADRIFEPAFVREALSAVSSPAGTPAR